MNLERLANELILDLFEYLTTAHLLHAFFNLNDRFNQLLLQYFQIHGLDFRAVFKNDFDTIFKHHYLQMIDRISSLSLSDENDTPGQIQQFYTHDLTLNQFNHLYSLTFYSFHTNLITHKLLDDLRQCHQLTHLIFKQCSFTFDQTSALLFVNNIWSLPKLSHCYLNIYFEHQLYFPVPTVFSMTLKYLSIFGIEPSLSQIDCLLQHTPNLRSLTTNFQSMSGFDQTLSTISSLMKLNLSFVFAWYNMIEKFLQWLPNLYSLKIDLKKTYIDGKKWEEIIRMNLINVKQLRFRMKFFSKKYDRTNEEQIDEILDSFRNSFWLDEHHWIVQCDWSPYNKNAYIYTLPFAFTDYELTFSVQSKTNSLQNNNNHLYDCVKHLIYNLPVDQCFFISQYQFLNIRHLSIQLPINNYFYSLVPQLNQLIILNVSSNKYSELIDIQLQSLLDNASHLRSITFEGLAWLSSSFEYKNTSISQLNFHLCFTYEQCIMLIRSSLGFQCEKLSISVENRRCILSLIERMNNLRALHVQCKNDRWTEQVNNKEDEFVQWLQHHLPSTCIITRNIHWDSAIRIWIC